MLRRERPRRIRQRPPAQARLRGLGRRRLWTLCSKSSTPSSSGSIPITPSSRASATAHGFAKVTENLHGSFGNFHHVLGEFVELGDRVLWHTIFCVRGRDGGAEVKIPEQHLWTIRDGKVWRLQWFHDAEEARRAADATDQEVEEPLEERLRAGYAAFNDGRRLRAGSCRSSEPEVEMVVSMGGPEGTHRIPRARRHRRVGTGDGRRLARHQGSSRSRSRVEPSRAASAGSSPVSARDGRASDMGLEGIEGPRCHARPRPGRWCDWRGSRDLDLARAAFEALCPGSMMASERA